MADNIDFQPSAPAGGIDFQPMDSGISMPESFGRGALNNFPLAQQATAALTPGDYSPNLANLNQKAGAAKAANPVSYGAGAVTGSLAPLAIPGVGEALEAAPVLGNAALGAANAIGNTDLTKNPGQAVRQGLQGAVIGGGVGKLGSMAAKALSPATEGLEKMANANAVQGAGLNPKMLGGLSEDEVNNLGSKINKWDLDQGTLPERAEKAQNLLAQKGQEIGQFGGNSFPLQDATPFTDALHKKLQESAEIYGPQSIPNRGVYETALANLQKPGGATFESLQNLKNSIGPKAFDASHQVRPNADALADVYHIYKDATKSIISGSPEEYQNAMTDYSHLKDITTGIQNQLGQARAGGLQTGGMGMAGRMVGMVAGDHPAVNVGAAAALFPVSKFASVGALTPLFNNPRVMGAAERGLAGAIPGATKGMTQELNDYLTSKYGKGAR